MTRGAAGYDLIWCPDPDVRPAIGPGMTVRTFATGFAVELPPGHWWLLKERYSLGKLGILVLGGVVDEDYREEVEVTMLGSEAAWTRADVQPGQRIAQAVLMRVHEDEIVQVDSLSRTDRGPGAGGSTGR
jgi:dUTP pyrophosphatase